MQLVYIVTTVGGGRGGREFESLKCLLP